MINPYTLIAIAGAWAVSLAGASYWAYGAGQDKEIAAPARESKASVQAAEIAARVSAEAISKIEVRNVHVRQALEREVITRDIYRDCRTGPLARELLNSTPGIAQPAAQPASSGKLSAVTAPD
jgi:hypothetical protein